MASSKNLLNNYIIEGSAFQISLKILFSLQGRLNEYLDKLSAILFQKYKKFIELIQSCKNENADESSSHYQIFVLFIEKYTEKQNIKIPANIEPIDILRIILIYFHNISSKILKFTNSLETGCNKGSCLLHDHFFLPEFSLVCEKCYKTERSKNINFSICQYFDTNKIVKKDYDFFENIARYPGYLIQNERFIQIISQLRANFVDTLRVMPEYFTGKYCCNHENHKKYFDKINQSPDFYLIDFEWKKSVNHLEALIVLSSISRNLNHSKDYERDLRKYELKSIVSKKDDRFMLINVYDLRDKTEINWLNLIQYLSLNCFYPMSLIYQKTDQEKPEFDMNYKDYIKLFKVVVQTNWLSQSCVFLNRMKSKPKSHYFISQNKPNEQALKQNQNKSIKKAQNLNQNFIV